MDLRLDNPNSGCICGHRKNEHRLPYRPECQVCECKAFREGKQCPECGGSGVRGKTVFEGDVIRQPLHVPANFCKKCNGVGKVA
jgi:DnaJ-class molecular chaperone